MDRAGRIIGITVLAGLAAFALFGGIPVGPVVLMLPLGVAGLGAMLFRRTGVVADLGWAGRAGTVRLPVPTVAGTGTGPGNQPEWESADRPPATPRQVGAALARAEARECLSSGWFATGVAFCLLITVLFGWVWTTEVDGSKSWPLWFAHFPIMAFPMVGMAVVGAHQAVTRSRRDGTEELFAACPTGEATRTAAHLRCGWIPAAAVAVFVTTMTVMVAVRIDRNYGPVDGRALADALTAVVLAACGVGLGVALGRWAPWRLAPILAVVALVPVITALGNLGDPHWSNLRQLSPWPRYPDHDLIFTDPPVWWHLIWLGALGALMGFVAVAHARRTRRVLAVGLGLAVIAAAAGIAQTRPLSDGAAARLASLIAEPAAHQTCRRAAGVEMCAYHRYDDYLNLTFPPAAAVAAAVPDSVATIRFRHDFDGDLDVLGPEVGRALARLPEPSGAYIPLGYGTGDADVDRVRLAAGVAAVGLPTRPDSDDRPLVIAGQSRGVVALWLAARGLSAADAQHLARHHYNPDDDTPDRAPTALDLGMAWPDTCVVRSGSPVAWAAQDLAAARALLALPGTEVQALLAGGWDRFTDPGTSTDELLAAAGLDPVGPADRVVAVPLRCSW